MTVSMRMKCLWVIPTIKMLKLQLRQLPICKHLVFLFFLLKKLVYYAFINGTKALFIKETPSSTVNFEFLVQMIYRLRKFSPTVSSSRPVLLLSRGSYDKNSCRPAWRQGRSTATPEGGWNADDVTWVSSSDYRTFHRHSGSILAVRTAWYMYIMPARIRKRLPYRSLPGINMLYLHRHFVHCFNLFLQLAGCMDKLIH